MVGNGQGLGQADNLVVRVIENTGSDLGVLLHDHPLGSIELARFEQDPVGNADLAHIVHGGGIEDGLHPFFGQPQFAGQGD